jgi:hypothetical protein
LHNHLRNHLTVGTPADHHGGGIFAESPGITEGAEESLVPESDNHFAPGMQVIQRDMFVYDTEPAEREIHSYDVAKQRHKEGVTKKGISKFLHK